MGLNNSPQYRANGTIGPMRFVIADSTADNMLLEAGVTSVATAGTLGTSQVPLIGISQVGEKRTPGLPGSDVTIAAAQGDVIQIYSLGDVAPIQVGATSVKAGDLLGQSGTTGLAKPLVYTAGTFAGVAAGARAIQAGTSGQVVLAQIVSEVR